MRTQFRKPPVRFKLVTLAKGLIAAALKLGHIDA